MLCFPHWYMARDLCDQDSLHVELVFLGFFGRTATQNGTLQGPPLPQRFASLMKSQISCLMLGRYSTSPARWSWHIKKSVGLPPRKIPSFLWLVKDDLGLKTVEYTASLVSVARSTLGRRALQLTPGFKSTSDIHLEHLDSQLWQSTVSTWGAASSYTTLSSSSPNPDRYMDRIVREVTELHPTGVNREDGFCLSKSWKPLICS